MSGPALGSIIPWSDPFVVQNRLVQLLGSHWDEQQRVRVVGNHHVWDSTNQVYNIWMLGSRATMYVNAQIQNNITGGITYNASTYVSRTQYDIRADRLQAIAVSTIRSRPYYLFLIPTFLESDGTYTLFDGVDAADHMTRIDFPPILDDVTTITTNTTLDNQNLVVLVDASSGAVTVTLPQVTSQNLMGQEYQIKKIDSSANAVTVDASTTETIDGELTQVLRDQWAALRIVADTTGWSIL